VLRPLRLTPPKLNYVTNDNKNRGPSGLVSFAMLILVPFCAFLWPLRFMESAGVRGIPAANTPKVIFLKKIAAKPDFRPADDP
jgi:hypothetical protein